MHRITLALTAVFTSMASGQTLQPRTGDPVDGLTTVERNAFFEGRQQFGRIILESEGRGPGFNGVSCVGCHNDPVRGGSSTAVVTRVGRVEVDGMYTDLAEFGGPVMQDQGLAEICADNFPASATAFTVRRTPALFGLGLVEALEDQTLIELASTQNVAGVVSGRVNMGVAIEDPNAELRVARFGFKAGVVSLEHFSADAAVNEIGLTNEFFPVDNAPSGDASAIAQCETVPDPEDVPDAQGKTYVDHITIYQRLLAAPPQTPQSGMRGETLFAQVGCAECHVPSLTTGDDPSLEEALRNRTFKPYSDFLVHDMGASGEGELEQGIAVGGEMRTTPLWGIRWRLGLWHDGSSGGNSLEERLLAPGYGAIDKHAVPGSEALASATAFRAMSMSDQLEVVRFLDSLGRAEFDADGNNRVNGADIASFQACYTGPGKFYTADDACAVHDLDADGDVDLDDLAGLLLALDVDQPDCDGNGLGDFDEILSGGDANGDLILDACQGPLGCPGDCDGTGFVSFDDLVCVLFSFGEAPIEGSPSDCDADGSIDFADLVCALFRFGLCESG